MIRAEHVVRLGVLLAALPFLSGLTACGRPRAGTGSEGASSEGPVVAISALEPAELAPGERPRIVATTSLVADVVQAVAGDDIEVLQLLPYGTDPHGYLATPSDLQRVTEAHLLFINGFGLEETLLDDLEAAASETRRVSISEGIAPRRLSAEGPDHEDESEIDHEHGLDPHVWMDPTNVMVWGDNAARALIALDPARSEAYRENASEYRQGLADLNQWIEAQVDAVPQGQRQLVTDHLVFGYFADRYGFEMIGAVIPAYSTQAEPSARELAELEDLIESRGARAVFVGITANRTLAQRVGDDLGVPLVPLYTGSLSDPDGPAGTYQQMMRYDVSAIVEALK